MPLFVLPYPIMDPIAFEIGPLAVRWYGLAYMAGILLGWLYGRRLVSRPDLWGGKPPMTVAQADDFLLWITLGGEVVVDYSLKFKAKYGKQTWVAGYTNDCMAYIPSQRVWKEGGYEAGAFTVYGLPAKTWAPQIEDQINACVDRLVKQVK